MALPGISIARILAERRAVARRNFGTTAGRTQAAAAQVESGARPPPDVTGTGGGGGPTPFLQTRAGITFADQLRRDADIAAAAETDERARIQHIRNLELQQGDQAFELKVIEDRIAEDARVSAEERERVRTANINQLRVERQGTFSTLMRSGDQVRAVLFALGFGPENDVFDVRARSLGTTVQELKGARGLKGTTQEAINRVLGRRVGTRLVRPGVTIGREGITGLGAPVKAARAFAQGGADVRTLLQSAFSVGSLRKGESPGISSARLAELISEVTPVGLL